MKRGIKVAGLGLLGLLAATNFIPEKNEGCKVEEPALVQTPQVSQGIDIDSDVKKLREVYPEMDKKQLRAIARMVYFEGFPDEIIGPNGSDKEYRKSFTGIAEVIRDRYMFDNCVENDFFEFDRKFCGINQFGGESRDFIDILSKEEKGEHQFSSWRFYNKFFTDGLNSLYHPELNKEKLELAYNTSLDVLLGDSNITKGALWYKNNPKSDEMRAKRGQKLQRWHNESMITVAEGKSEEACGLISNLRDKIVEGQKVQCRIESQYIADNDDIVIGGHNYYHGHISDTEYIWNDTKGKSYKWPTN